MSTISFLPWIARFAGCRQCCVLCGQLFLGGSRLPTGFRVSWARRRDKNPRLGLVAANFLVFMPYHAHYLSQRRRLRRFYSPLLIVVLLLCTVVCAIVFRPPRELREPLAQILHDDLQRTVACVASAACLLLLCGYLSTVLTNLVVGAALVVAHALTKKITSRSRLSKMWFNVRFFGNRAAEDLPDGGAAQHAHDADIADTAAQGAGGATALDSWGAGSDTMLPQAAPPGPRMQVGSSAAVDVDNIDLEAGSATGPVHRPPSIKRD